MESRVGKICPYCQSAIEEGSQINVCPNCFIPHHKECWMENQGCTTFGCRYAPVVSNSLPQNTGLSSNRPRTIEPAGVADGVICPYCGQATSSTRNTCQYCQGVLYAGFWNRVWAWMIDKLVITFSSYILIFVLLMLTLIPAVFIKSDKLAGIAGLGWIIAFFLLNWLYYAICESSSWRATPGKVVLGLAVTDVQGRKLTFWRATARFFGSFVSAILLFLGYLPSAFTPRKQTLHDIMSGTVVVRSVRVNQEGKDSNANRRLIIGVLMGIMMFGWALIPYFMFEMMGSLVPAIKASDLAEEGNHKEAIKYYTRAIEKRDFMSWTNYEQRGDSYKTIGQFDKAIADYDQAMKTYDQTVEEGEQQSKILLNRGICYKHMGQYDKAMQDIQSYIQTNPKDPEAYYERSGVYFNLGQRAKEKVDLDKAILLDPEYYAAIHERGCFLLDEKNYAAALEDFAICTNLDPSYPQGWHGCAKAHMGMGHYKNALDCLEEVISMNSENPYSYVLQAQCYEKMKDFAKAKQSYQKALSVHPGYEEAVSGLEKLKATH